MVAKGSKQVVECAICECYMMKQPEATKCVNCRREAGEIDNERYLDASTRKRRGSTLGMQKIPILEA
jgi:hypothetical protein